MSPIPWQSATLEAEAAHLQFAVASEVPSLRVPLVLTLPPGTPTPVGSQVTARPNTARAVLNPGLQLHVDLPPFANEDDDFHVEVTCIDPAVPLLVVHIRRTACRVETPLILEPVAPETRAALLWYGWRRFDALVGMKRFNSGLSGGEVVVVRPQLPSGDWGSWLLVKTGKAVDVRQEWGRFRDHLADRMTPFLARSEQLLCVLDGTNPEFRDPPLATLVSSFVGGELVTTEQLQQVVRGSTDSGHARRLIDRLYTQLEPWHRGGELRTLGEWARFFREPSTPEGHLRLFNKPFDFADLEDCRDFCRGLQWDAAFKKHLEERLLGTKHDGLLYAIRDGIALRFGLTHGDLNARNVLARQDDVWLIDFEHTGVAPTLFDFAWLEADLRLWCLELGDPGDDLGLTAEGFEAELLDHFQGGEGSLEPVRRRARGLGADPVELGRLAEVIAHIRVRAQPYCNRAYPDRRDYLAVLFLCVLNLLRFASKERSAPPANYRLLMGLFWTLEDTLARILGRTPFVRDRVPTEPHRLLTAAWLTAEGAPQRVRYLMDREDGRRVLAPVAGTLGVMQGGYHHLDVFDHSLLVLAHVEEWLGLADPTQPLVSTATQDERVRTSLERQGIRLPGPLKSYDDITIDEPIRADAEAVLLEALEDDGAKSLVKWFALLHDVGKPGTRSMSAPRKNVPPVHFHGHERYGVSLLQKHLLWLFPESEVRGRFEELILRHHDHNDRGRNCHASGSLEKLLAVLRDPYGLEQQAFESGFKEGCEWLFADLEGEFWKPLYEGKPIEACRRPDLPLLLLHGHADSLASRGPTQLIPLDERGRIYLAVLAFYRRFDSLCRALTHHQQIADRVLNVMRGSGIEGKKRGEAEKKLRAWAREVCRERGNCPATEELIDFAAKLVTENR